jgi:hypothetical protein
MDLKLHCLKTSKTLNNQPSQMILFVFLSSQKDNPRIKLLI